MPSKCNISLIAALALAKHAPNFPKSIQSKDDQRNLTKSPDQMEGCVHYNRPKRNSYTTNSTDSHATQSGSDNECPSLSSVKTSTSSMEDILNDPIFNQALENVKNAVYNPSNAKVNMGSLAMEDPKIRDAIEQACLVMRKPEFQAIANKKASDVASRRNSDDFYVNDKPYKSNHSALKTSVSSPALIIPSNDADSILNLL